MWLFLVFVVSKAKLPSPSGLVEKTKSEDGEKEIAKDTFLQRFSMNKPFALLNREALFLSIRFGQDVFFLQNFILLTQKYTFLFPIFVCRRKTDHDFYLWKREHFPKIRPKTFWKRKTRWSRQTRIFCVFLREKKKWREEISREGFLAELNFFFPFSHEIGRRNLDLFLEK